MGGVASVNGVEGFGPEAAKDRLFEIYIDKMNALLRLLPALLLLFLHLRIVSSLFLFFFFDSVREARIWNWFSWCF